MQKYNFVKPITVTVIYEEDEENVIEINNNEINFQNMPNQGMDQSKPTFSRKTAQIKTECANSKDDYHMLLTVAENISKIVEVYNYYIQCLKQNEKNAILLKFHYIHTKSRYYRQSFEVAYRLLLPQKTNEHLKHFLVKKIIELSKVKIDPMYVRGLCNDLILWTEGMKDKILAQSKVDNVSNKIDEKQYVSNNLKRKYNQDNVAKENKVAIFSAGQKGSEIILSVDAQYLNVEHNSQRDNSNKRTREISKVEQNVPYTSVITTPSSELDNTLQTDTQSNSHKHFVKENRSLNNINFSNNNNLENSFNKSIPRSCASNNANDLIKNINYSNQNNVISKIKRRIAHNLRNQEQNTMSGVVKQESKSCSLSNQTVLDRKKSAFYPQTLETGQRASYQSIPNAVTHNNTVSQNQMHRPNQNTLDYMANYPTSMPLQYNTTNNVPQRTNLNGSIKTVNSHINQKYEHRYITNTLPPVYQDYCNNYMIDRGQQNNYNCSQYKFQETGTSKRQLQNLYVHK
ncbi:PREDICTED: protein kinase 4-like isoform X2 [Papilio xuthus]|uniref:Protein kinase 4-like isoform X2 n=2 Tax=Papilio xuthus TaxID=66420 RepID=A0AAJ6Z356_PAPXU|nr:PREDICTED: protein kinase 4-like isoform X2 [Papilio xuthus]XP_013164523.1 PREDICTED: protein kinase 4-like isoform X2 [Papilio xuthus]